MTKFVMSSAVLLMLAACGGSRGADAGASADAMASDGNEEVVCDQQSRWAQSGKIDGSNITITCPGNARPAY